jgi:hypothetical protein
LAVAIFLVGAADKGPLSWAALTEAGEKPASAHRPTRAVIAAIPPSTVLMSISLG